MPGSLPARAASVFGRVYKRDGRRLSARPVQEVKAPRPEGDVELAAGALEARARQAVAQVPRRARERHLDATLRERVTEVDDHELVRPGPGHEVVVRVVVRPACALAQ